MSPELLVAIFSLTGTLVGSLAGILTANRLMSYRVEQLEKKVDAYNGIRDRVTVTERDLKSVCARIDDVRRDMESYLK